MSRPRTMAGEQARGCEMRPGQRHTAPLLLWGAVSACARELELGGGLQGPQLSDCPWASSPFGGASEAVV